MGEKWPKLTEAIGASEMETLKKELQALYDVQTKLLNEVLILTMGQASKAGDTTQKPSETLQSAAQKPAQPGTAAGTQPPAS